MIYYIYTLKFFNQIGERVVVENRAHCEDIDYEQSLTQSKGIVYEQAKALNDNLDLSDYSDSVEIIQEQEYLDFFSGEMPIE